MKSAEEIVAHLAVIIADVHWRPALYIGSTSQPRSGDHLESYLSMLHSLWAFPQSRDKELSDARWKIGEKYYRGPRDFATTFREDHQSEDEDAVCKHVLKCWAMIDELLGIDISEAASKNHSSTTQPKQSYS
jgi:hypothetical protein